MARRRLGNGVPMAVIPPWTNPVVELFHGTLDIHVPAILAGVHVAAGPAHRDFGRGFYTTTLFTQARALALRRARGVTGAAAVIRFRLDRNALADLESLWFVRGDPGATDYWELVRHCRVSGGNHNRGLGHGNWYDVVVGPVAASWGRQPSVIAGYDQVSFHSARAAQLLDAGNPVRVL